MTAKASMHALSLASVITLLITGSAAAQASGSDDSAERRPVEPVPVSDGTSGGPYTDQPAEATSGRSTGTTTQTPPPAAEPREEEGDGRAADILWIEAGLGWSYVDLVMLRQDNFLPRADQLKDSGFTFTVAAGFRLAIITIGARASLASYLGAEVGTAVADIALRLPTPVVEPYFRVGLGYGWVGAADYDQPDNSETTVFGLVGEAGAGVDIYLDRIFAIGGGFDVAFLNLSRQEVDMCSGASDPMCMLGEVDFSEDGDALGVQMRIHGHASLHF